MALNLTAASHVMLLEPWWNPAVENQAADRIHRLGASPAIPYCLPTKLIRSDACLNEATVGDARWAGLLLLLLAYCPLLYCYYCLFSV